MKTPLLIAAAVIGSAQIALRADGYVVAVEKATYADPAWRPVAETLKNRHRAHLVTYDGNANLENLLPELRRLAPDYVAFVSRPETAGRDLVVSAAQLLRRLDDDPYGDALWGIVTGFDAADALRIANAPAVREIRRPASSMGSPGCLDAWESGFASNEGNRNELWRKFPGGKAEKIDTQGNVTRHLADTFNAIDVDYFVTSGHATQHDWQIIYNQNAGSLHHDAAGNLRFRDPSGEYYPLKRSSPKAYLAAGNCLIGHIDRRDSMATAWLHAGGAEQMCGYTVITFYGFMGWGVKSLLEEGRASFAESYYLQNQILLWALGEIKPELQTVRFTADEFGDGRNVRKFIQAHAREFTVPSDSVAGKHRPKRLGLLWDRDTVAFYGDPAERITFPARYRTVEIDVADRDVTIHFLKDLEFGPLADVKSARPIATLLAKPPHGRRLLSADGKPVERAVVNDRFLIIPLTGKFKAGDTVKLHLAN